MTCSVCHRSLDELAAGRAGAVMLTRQAQIGRRKVEWQICGECAAKEQK